jgi:hypothetical protein
MTKYGRINDNVGFRKVDGVTRQLTIREQLLRVQNFKGINTIKHPTYGQMEIDRNKVESLLQLDENQLTNMTKEEFQ